MYRIIELREIFRHYRRIYRSLSSSSFNPWVMTHKQQSRVAMAYPSFQSSFNACPKKPCVNSMSYPAIKVTEKDNKFSYRGEKKANQDRGHRVIVSLWATENKGPFNFKGFIRLRIE